MKKTFLVILSLFVTTAIFAIDHKSGNQDFYSLKENNYICEYDGMFYHTYKTYFWFSKEDAEATQRDIEEHIKNDWLLVGIYPTGNGCIISYQKKWGK